LNQFFFPDSAATSQLLTDVAGALAADGHSVRVICGRGGYAKANVGAVPGVTVVRTRALPFGHGAPARVLSYISYLCGAIWFGLRSERPDVVLSLTTPPLLSLVAWLVTALRGGRFFIWEMDLYPDIAVDLGVLRAKSWFTRALGWALDRVRCRAAGVIALGDSMRERLLRHGIPSDRIHVAENWADSNDIQPRRFPPHDTLAVLYSGNLGLAHDVITLYGALETLAADARFRFIFAGGGPRREALERFCAQHQVRNVEFRGYCQRQELTDSLAACHVGLVTQKPETVGAVVPSKVYGLMAAGRPILYIGPAAGTPARLIRRFGCGWRVEPGDVEGFIAILEWLSEHPGEVEQAGQKAYAAFEAHYDRPAGVQRIGQIIGVNLHSSVAVSLQSS
jgi:glycosyltransferase involved in cell wall biosynthesis